MCPSLLCYVLGNGWERIYLNVGVVSRYQCHFYVSIHMVHGLTLNDDCSLNFALYLPLFRLYLLL
jgi:hypothetical protein